MFVSVWVTAVELPYMVWLGLRNDCFQLYINETNYSLPILRELYAFLDLSCQKN